MYHFRKQKSDKKIFMLKVFGGLLSFSKELAKLILIIYYIYYNIYNILLISIKQYLFNLETLLSVVGKWVTG